MLNTHTLVFFLGGDVAFIQLRSYQDCACLQHWYHAADTGHDTILRHSIQTHGRPVAVLSIDVERYTDTKLPILLSWVRPDREIIPLPFTHDLSLCYPLMWNVTLEYTATHFNVLGETRPGNPSPT